MSINLLPNKPSRIEKAKRRFVGCLLLLLLMAMSLTGFWHSVLHERHKTMQLHTQQLQQQIHQAQQALAQFDTVKQTHHDVINTLLKRHQWQQKRDQATAVMQHITNHLPEGVQLQALDYQQGVLTLTGVTAKAHALSAWMSVLAKNPDFSRPSIVLHDSQNREFKHTTRFVVTVNAFNQQSSL